MDGSLEVMQPNPGMDTVFIIIIIILKTPS